ncbi:MAG TPA: gamma-glutamyltransferase, partial [Paraburkholderia sp.]
MTRHSSVPSHEDATPRLARSTRGMVTSPHTLASAAGLDVLRAGGNAIEAAIVTAAALSVTYPHFNGLGGDAFWIIAERDGAVRTLSGIGQAAADVSRYPLGSTHAWPLRGAASALTTAATVDSWGLAHDISARDWGGTRSWASLFEPAIHHARDGFPVSVSQSFWMQLRAAELRALPGFAATFAPHGRIPAQGERFAQPALARSLERIATHGVREFYEGELAERIARGLADAGSPLTFADLAATRARDEPPLRVTYRGGELVTLAPPTQGVTTLQIMGMLERFDLASIAEGSTDYYHVLVEAVKRAFIDRERYVSDPEFDAVPIDAMLSRASLDAHARAIDRHKARAWPHVFRQGDTAFIGVADDAGRCVSL